MLQPHNHKTLAMKIIVTTIVFTLCASILFAQQNFVAKGRIEFEKKENLYKIADVSFGNDDDDDNGGDSWKNTMKKSVPNFKNSYYNLYFDESKTLYKAGRENDQKYPDFWFTQTISENVVYNDLQSQKTTSQKTFFNSSFLITDSMRHIDWRITNEVRTIAGFECRKATAIIMDSVYVIAFYTDQILASGGPESFTGLPGMILGIAIPRINTTWFATKLEVIPVTDAQMPIPVKGKKITNTDFKGILQKSMKDWGKFGSRNMLLVSI